MRLLAKSTADFVRLDGVVDGSLRRVRPGSSYLSLVLRQVGLADTKWLADRRPFVFARVSVGAGRDIREFVRAVGPSLLSYNDKSPRHLIMSNMGLVGPIPYLGESIGLELVLSDYEQSAQSSAFFTLAEKVSGAVVGGIFGAEAATLVEIVGSSVQRLLSSTSAPLAGVLQDFNAVQLIPGFYLLYLGSKKLDVSGLSFRDNRLTSISDGADELAGLDYVVVEIRAQESLSEGEYNGVCEFRERRLTILEHARIPGHWEVAKAQMVSLLNDLSRSRLLLERDIETIIGRLRRDAERQRVGVDQAVAGAESRSVQLSKSEAALADLISPSNGDQTV